MDEQKIRILEATIKVFNEKGLKFTMDDVAKELSMSKKTIYNVFRDKESIFYEMVDYCFDKIKESEQAVMNDTSLPTVDKIKKILGVLPDGYREIDFRKLIALRDKYPTIYLHVEERLESGWESTIALLEQGVREGVVRPINLVIFKTAFESTIEHFLQRDVLAPNNITYQDALDQLVDILVDGITVG